MKAHDSREFPNLLCEELPTWDRLRRSFADPVMLNDGRVLENLLTIEDRCLPSTKYFDFQLEIQPYMRRILTSWMLEVIIAVSIVSSRLDYSNSILFGTSVSNLRKTLLLK